MKNEEMPKPIITIGGDEYVINITPNTDGIRFNVTVHDNDTFEHIIQGRIFHTKELAENYAYNL